MSAGGQRRHLASRIATLAAHCWRRASDALALHEEIAELTRERDEARRRLKVRDFSARRLAEISDELRRARAWGRLWHSRARAYKRAFQVTQDAAEAQREQERLAAEQCGISAENAREWGCDWPGAAAAHILHLRAERARDAEERAALAKRCEDAERALASATDLARRRAQQAFEKNLPSGVAWQLVLEDLRAERDQADEQCLDLREAATALCSFWHEGPTAGSDELAAALAPLVERLRAAIKISPARSPVLREAAERLLNSGVIYWDQDAEKWRSLPSFVVPVGSITSRCLVCGGWDGEHTNCAAEDLRAALAGSAAPAFRSSGLPAGAIAFVDERIDSILTRPEMFGSTESALFQVLLLLELRCWPTTHRSIQDAWRRHESEVCPTKPGAVPLHQWLSTGDGLDWRYKHAPEVSAQAVVIKHLAAFVKKTRAGSAPR